MNWIFLVGIFMVIAAIAAVTGVKPKGTRPVAGTRMMGVARVVLVLVAVVLVYFAVRGSA